ncbi:unnamed protein product [Parascedosporium putredinis]|uniref:Spo12-like protein n=1 Tax=Parascedosporium putredinis TaxID=1442378 RepID=A0A9P1H1Q9_9PEZI|nr:unnamed protein product [Parascedosporium putredinis]CAI7992981.1 unnamed protein product [Parascedosporium putredinis]
MSGVLSNKDINVPMLAAEQPTGKPIQSMEYHRQVLQSKMDAEQSVQRLQNKQYVSPSDNIMSPCTAKLTALRNKQVGKVKPKSLFAQGVAKKLDSAKKDSPF